eukprot:TRINITY_DN5144_c0_g2_i1.p2 TRINITY_DN5144_c0_g2~~TRINITY_DN5144_c0_g2_i1.p2  ORF type:complete len:342 (+),score=62.47 TRINITY_DN5144_c0_g2_i1:84-1028(+)
MPVGNVGSIAAVRATRRIKGSARPHVLKQKQIFAEREQRVEDAGNSLFDVVVGSATKAANSATLAAKNVFEVARGKLAEKRHTKIDAKEEEDKLSVPTPLRIGRRDVVDPEAVKLLVGIGASPEQAARALKERRGDALAESFLQQNFESISDGISSPAVLAAAVASTRASAVPQARQQLPNKQATLAPSTKRRLPDSCCAAAPPGEDTFIEVTPSQFIAAPAVDDFDKGVHAGSARPVASCLGGRATSDTKARLCMIEISGVEADVVTPQCAIGQREADAPASALEGRMPVSMAPSVGTWLHVRRRGAAVADIA